MDLFNMMKNIRGINNEEEIIKAINEVKKELNDLTEERTCKIYSSYIVNELKDKHVPVRLINTLDLGIDFEHHFVIVPSNDFGDYFIVDLTFTQFNKDSDVFKDLINKGYQVLNDYSLNCYLRVVSNNEYDQYISMDDIYYMDNINKKM